jgi:transposase
VRATTLLNGLLNLPGIAVRGVSLPVDRAAPMVVTVALRAWRLACPLCDFTTRARYDTRSEPSWWRHLDFGTAPVIVRAMLRRLDCPEHGVLVEAVPFARHRSRFTTDFEDVAAFLATKTDKTTIARFCASTGIPSVGSVNGSWQQSWTPNAWPAWSTSASTRCRGVNTISI